MDPVTILADVTAVINVAKLAIDAAQDAAPFVESVYQILSTGTGLTDAQRADLATQEAALRAQLDAPSIPADQP